MGSNMCVCVCVCVCGLTWVCSYLGEWRNSEDRTGDGRRELVIFIIFNGGSCRRTCARSNRKTSFPSDFPGVSRQTCAGGTWLLVGVRDVARARKTRARLLDLNQRVHDPRRGCPTGVTISPTTPRDGNVDGVLARSHARTLTHDGGRVVVVVATVCVHRSRQRRSTRFPIHLQFPSTPLAMA